MIIVPTGMVESGPGIDLSNQPEGLSIQMSDPVEDFEYTLIARLRFCGPGSIRAANVAEHLCVESKT